MTEEIILEKTLSPSEASEFFFNQIGETLRVLEESLGVVISARGDKLFIKGPVAEAHEAERIIEQMKALRKRGQAMTKEEVEGALLAMRSGEATDIEETRRFNISVPSKKRFIVPKTETQRRYIEAIRRSDIVFGIGPAGTGKTYLAMAMAINALMNKKVSRIVLARPAVEAGERLGFLPGDMYEKVHPYLRPLYDALFEMMDLDRAQRFIEKGVIEIAPLAYMRGRTLNDAFVILDEAQNTTTEQMKMYLTRLGFNSKTVITGDITQIDLPQDRPSGLVQAMEILQGISGIEFVYFSKQDVVRHPLVQEIIKAYENAEKRKKETIKE
ncbi:MAG: PhoH family protein [Nitrospirae bacterium]|nr:MAG: PhoH family protein [Nitrospirota bacterium]